MSSGKWKIDTGRKHQRTVGICKSCEARLMAGPPKAGEGMWPARLHIDERNMDLLLVAAAEFVELCEEAGEYADAVAFVDWVRPDAITNAWESPVKAEPPPVSLAEKRRRHEAGAA